MGIADREYSRSGRPRGGGGWHWRSMNRLLIIANIAVMAVQIVIPDRLGMFPWPTDPLSDLGHFSTAKVMWSGGLEFWRVLTFQFLHANLIHIFMNMLGLHYFGDLVEERLGSKRFLGFYLTCGIAGALMYFLLNAIGWWVVHEMGGPRIPGLLFADPATPLIGASAGVFGIILASAYIKPDEEANLLFLPIPVKLKRLAYAYVAFAMVSLILGSRNAGGEAAHVGGGVAGYILIRNPHLLRDFFDVFGDSRKRPKLKIAEETSVPRRMGRTAMNTAELERVLAKIKAEGIDSLTPAEQEFLARETEQKRRDEQTRTEL